MITRTAPATSATATEAGGNRRGVARRSAPQRQSGLPPPPAGWPDPTDRRRGAGRARGGTEEVARTGTRQQPVIPLAGHQQRLPVRRPRDGLALGLQRQQERLLLHAGRQSRVDHGVDVVAQDVSVPLWADGAVGHEAALTLDPRRDVHLGAGHALRQFVQAPAGELLRHDPEPCRAGVGQQRLGVVWPVLVREAVGARRHRARAGPWARGCGAPAPPATSRGCRRCRRARAPRGPCVAPGAIASRSRASMPRTVTSREDPAGRGVHREDDRTPGRVVVQPEDVGCRRPRDR